MPDDARNACDARRLRNSFSDAPRIDGGAGAIGALSSASNCASTAAASDEFGVERGGHLRARCGDGGFEMRVVARQCGGLRVAQIEDGELARER